LECGEHRRFGFFFVAPGYLACRSAGVRYDKSCRSP
jgi:hypothetical protein